MNKFVIVSAALLAGCLTVTAQATAVRDVPHKVVSYADLDLDKPADAAILLVRIGSAARNVCGLRRAGLMPLAITQRLEVCVAEATARAIADVDAPRLTEQREIVVRNVE